MKLLEIAYEVTCGLGVGFEYVKGEWLSDWDKYSYFTIDFLCFRVVFTFEG